MFQVSGYQFSVPEFSERRKALFLPITVSWGWATWKRAWRQFDPQASGWQRLRRDTRFRRKFNVNGVYDYATMMLRQAQGVRDSWAIRWYWTVFKNDGLTLFPPRTLVRNTGFDGSGTHGKGKLRNFSGDSGDLVEINLPEWPQVSLVHTDFRIVQSALWRMNGRFLGASIDKARWYSTLFAANFSQKKFFRQQANRTRNGNE